MVLLDEAGWGDAGLFHEDAGSCSDPPRYHLACRPLDLTVSRSRYTRPSDDRLFRGCDGPDPFGSTGPLTVWGDRPFFRRLTGDSRITVVDQFYPAATAPRNPAQAGGWRDQHRARRCSFAVRD